MKKSSYKHFIIASLFLVYQHTVILAAATQKTADTFPDPVEYLQNLTPEQIQVLQRTAQDRLNNLTPKQKEELVQTAKDYLNNISPAEKQALIESTEKNLNMITPEQKQALNQLQNKAENQGRRNKLN